MGKTDIRLIRKQLMKWYQANQRDLPWRRSNVPYHVWVSEVMLQQTQVKTVLDYYRRFLTKFPDIQHLAAADLEAVLKVWEGLGYYARARNLHRAAQAVMQDHGGQIPNQWETFHKLPGVGDYIAAAVLSIAFNQPYAVIDGNVKRVLARLQKIHAPVNQANSNKQFKNAAARLLDSRQSLQPGHDGTRCLDLQAPKSYVRCLPLDPLLPGLPGPADRRFSKTEKIKGHTAISYRRRRCF